MAEAGVESHLEILGSINVLDGRYAFDNELNKVAHTAADHSPDKTAVFDTLKAGRICC